LKNFYPIYGWRHIIKPYWNKKWDSLFEVEISERWGKEVERPLKQISLEQTIYDSRLKPILL